MTDDPTNKAELLGQITSARTTLADLLAGLTDAQLTTPGPNGGWSVKDHLAHLTAWEAGIAALLQRRPRYAAMGIDAATFLGPEDTLNAIIRERNADRSLEEVRADLAGAQRSLLDAVAPITDADLQKTYSHYQPGEPGEDSGAPIIGRVSDNTAHHYEEHRALIQALVR
jgi:uncharacterized protein (TIGR03083 family)